MGGGTLAGSRPVKRLILADIHANLPAFEAVMRDAPAVDEILFLGDIVGYGPHPAECVDLLRDLAPVAILGNHDAELLQRAQQTEWSNSPHCLWLRWTIERLSPEQIAYLQSLPTALQIQSGPASVTVIHQTPGRNYLRPSSNQEEVAEALHGVPGTLVYCGHVHRAMRFHLPGRELVSFPAVGQPRNRDPRAGYAIETDGHLDFRYVPYDTDATLQAIAAIPLPMSFATRWCQFVQTGYDAEWSRE
jgi:predicted phosphodiesterase